VKEDNSDEAFLEYLRLAKETTERQGFFAHNETYHRTMWDIMRRSGIAHLFTARYGSDILAAWIIFAFEDTIYYPYGASGRLHRETMAPTLLLWEIARWGKRNGYEKFDLWGALGPNADPTDPWFGFHRFKEGFSPDLVEFVGSFDLILKPALYRLYTIADKIRWTILKTLKK
jgi:lipid II:glycine glycyltransferase (peptidoglycan interpeptide bridge formation enzyme)